jgi:site-specific recombinase XerD
MNVTEVGNYQCSTGATRGCLRAFFRFAQKRKWLTENPALDLKAPKITLCPTLPFGREEMV